MRKPERLLVVKGFHISLISWGNTYLAAYSLSGNFFCELTFIITIIYLRGTNNKRQTLLQPKADRKLQNNTVSRSCYHLKQHKRSYVNSWKDYKNLAAQHPANLWPLCCQHTHRIKYVQVKPFSSMRTTKISSHHYTTFLAFI